MKQRGFTVVELIITITIMGILLILTIVNINGNQVASRDNERTADIATIQTWMENFYSAGSPVNGIPGNYPAVQVTTPTNFQPNIPDADPKTFTAPGASNNFTSFIQATNSVQTTTGVAPQPTISQYVYQPIDSTGAICSNGLDCRKYNIYYRLEKDNTVYMVMSKNQ
ncbi:MAG: type II secretion system protein [Candidatus Saccharimonadales bacterium]